MKNIKNFIKESIKKLRFNKKRSALLADSVKFSYDEREILRDINLNVREGSSTAIIGKSGCGKSTFLKLAAGIISKRYFGNIAILGRSKVFTKDQVGFVPQELAFIPDLSLLDNIKIAGLNNGMTERAAVKKAQQLMRMLKLEEDINKKPTELSGGQKVRLNIILSLLHSPKVLILDEPFVALDFFNRRLLWQFLESMRKKGKSIIITSHLLSEVQEHVDRLIIIKDGKVFFSGKIDALKEKLKMKYVFELKFFYLSKENLNRIKKYCAYKDIKILDTYERYMMFALNSKIARPVLLHMFNKLKLKYEEIDLREPNLDEIFLKT
ncbi:ABC transporter ATP-binding protein [Candidatus Woesearchaeota archaeon]|nr:ABC transporter ATP-binding protein [Candidatus Woesearchaeota archaeon]